MSASAQLFADFTVNQSNGNAALKGEFIVRHSASRTLPAAFIVKHPGTVTLKGICVINQVASLKGVLIVRHPDSKILFAKFEIQDSEDLKGEFIIRHSASTTLFAKFVVIHSASSAIFAKYKVAIHFSGTPRNLFAKFFRGADASKDLKAVFNVTQDINLKAKFAVRHSNTKNLFADFKVKIFFVEGWADLRTEFMPRRVASRELSAEAIIRNKGSAELLSLSTIRHSSSTALKAFAILRHSSSAVLESKTVIRHSASRSLEARFLPRRSASLALFAKFEPIPNRDLKAKAIIRHSTTRTLHVDFFIRHPYRLWTNRRYINGVVEAVEKMIGDATLEGIIEGVMDDIKTFLLANQIQTYVGWHTIEDVPIIIRRACTYGVVASLYSRYTKTFTSRVIPTVAPVTVTVKGDEWEAMEFWENKFEVMLQRYLDYTLTGRIFSTTSDEEPIFSMEDIPSGVSTSQTWHEWYQQREEG